MLKHILLKQNFRQLKMHLNIIVGIILVLSACRDFVDESDTSVCNSAIDARNYDKALSVCTSRKDKASAYLGKAGYDIINLMDSAGTTVSQYTKPLALGKDDVAGATILNILKLSEDYYPNYDARATAISSSRTNLDLASDELQPYLNHNSQPLNTDEILLNTFAISFAMQLNQLEIYDNATTTEEAFPEAVNRNDLDNYTCTPVSISDSDAQAKLKAMDGHLWTTERNGMQCSRILAGIKGINDASEKAAAFADFKVWADNASRKILPDTLITPVCGPISALTDYLEDLIRNIEELTLSGDNTKAISESQTSSDTLLKAVGCR